MTLLWLLACAGTTSENDPEDTKVEPGDGPGMFGRVQDPPRENNIEDALIYEFERPSVSATSDVNGNWWMPSPDLDYVYLRVEKDGRIPVEIWISPHEAADPSFPYPLVMGTESDHIALYGQFGATPMPDKTTLFVDAMGSDNSCIGGAVVNISLPYEAAWRQGEDGQWSQENLTNPDWMDLMFVNVDPGMVAMDVTDPHGNACVGPDNVELKAGILTQVSYYCDMPGFTP